jgi:AraC family transcriptional regulator, glycine betaine-responsive activator
MFGGSNEGKPHRIGFVLLPEFTMIGFSAGVEPFRLANRLAEKTLYACDVFSEDGAPVKASNGLSVNVDGSFNDIQGLETIFVCSGLNVKAHISKALIQKLRRLASHGTGIGAICTGSEVLAKAGLLDGYSCTIHWENIPSFVEEYPDLDVVTELFEIDRNRYTCAGGTAALDMSLQLIALHFDSITAAGVADQLIHHRIREGGEGQRMELRTRLGVSHPKLLAVIQKMEDSLEEPINCEELAEGVGLSTRQLERLFRKYLSTAPTKYYLSLRLSRARFLLRQTSLPILSIALACGFVSASHFSKCYREHYQRTPSVERRVA